MQIIYYKLEYGDKPINGFKIPFTGIVVNGTLKYHRGELVRGAYEYCYNKEKIICKIDGWKWL